MHDYIMERSIVDKRYDIYIILIFMFKDISTYQYRSNVMMLTILRMMIRYVRSNIEYSHNYTHLCDLYNDIHTRVNDKDPSRSKSFTISIIYRTLRPIYEKTIFYDFGYQRICKIDTTYVLPGVKDMRNENMKDEVNINDKDDIYRNSKNMKIIREIDSFYRYMEHYNKKQIMLNDFDMDTDFRFTCDIGSEATISINSFKDNDNSEYAKYVREYVAKDIIKKNVKKIRVPHDDTTIFGEIKNINFLYL